MIWNKWYRHKMRRTPVIAPVEFYRDIATMRRLVYSFSLVQFKFHIIQE